MSRPPLSARPRPSAPRRAAVVGLACAALLAIASASAADGPQPSRGSGGEGTSSSSDGGAPARFSGVVRPPDLDDVEHMCALLTGCPRLPLPPGFVPRDVPGCVRALADELASPRAAAFSLTLRECGLRASSCGELRTCALRGARADVCAGRGKSGPVDMCDDSGRAVTCSQERPVLVRDCPRGGEQCVVAAGKATCALGPCEGDAAPTCSPSGTRIVECRKGKLVSSDCSAFGLRCAAGPEGPWCVSSTPSCTGEGTTRCDGDVGVTCWHGREVRVDCGAAGLACATGGAPAGKMGACVVPAKSEGACDPKATAKCDGATLTWCAWGKPRSYLCKSMGLSRCVSDDKGARCVP